jgi:uncharacterized protein
VGGRRPRPARRRILIVADTHVPDHAAALPREVLREATRADLILHAGDVTSAAVLDELGERAPVVCALGNNDGPEVDAWGASDRVEVEVAGVPFAMVHDAGPRQGRPARLRRMFPDARAIIFGHSHIPMAFRENSTWFLNPGSPTWKRREPLASFLVATVVAGRVAPKLIRFPAPPRGALRGRAYESPRPGAR